jgi:hypothetical protein
MATVVLQYAGAALGTLIGGPLGGVLGRAAGALAGNALDQQIFGKKQKHEGPRLSDLRVMASEEGAAIPALWGRMRFSGQVIWATNLIEEASTNTKKASAKGGPKVKTTTYAYYANFAVGLCEGEIDRIGRVWADGREIDISGFTWRLYTGSETQAPDSLIEAVDGAQSTPAYRGLAYIVFERLPLEDFGNRIPQLAFEVMRKGSSAAERLRAINIIPGSTEFGYDTAIVQRQLRRGQVASENAHVSSEQSDWSISLDQLQGTASNLGMASLVVAWFGNDLRCGQCSIRPGVDNAAKETVGATWQVSGIGRSSAQEVSKSDGVPAFGGTPSDASVLHAIADLKTRGLKVMFYPFVLMDVPQGNTLPDPHGGVSQAAYPWRGRITASIAPGRAGTPDKTAAAASEVASFTGTTAASAFQAAGETVAFSGGEDWSYRRMILHYAKLCAMAGGVDAFLIGSELRGLTTLRSAASTYPFVAALQALAADVKAILPDAAVSYAADWSEYFGHQPQDGTGDVHFHLDPLWASAQVDFIGIDNYMPLSDWRDGNSHVDKAAGWASIHDPTYLAAGIAGGEGYDWYYASQADREVQLRTPVSDGAYGKPWVFRPKDVKNWWLNAHHDRPGGIENVSATAWQPQSKPVWFTELGCPAIDKGTNGPNVFVDAKSSENAVPPFSGGQPDDVIQNRYLTVMSDYWSTTGAHNPVSAVTGLPMVPADRLFFWAWDARPYPAFPVRTDIWGDGSNHARGHWLNGRLGAVDLAELIASVAERFGLEGIDAGDVTGLVDGYVLDRPMSEREALETLLRAFALDAVESGGKMIIRPRNIAGGVNLSRHELMDAGAGKPVFHRTRAQETDLPSTVRISYIDSGLDYRSAAVMQARAGSHSAREIALSLPAAVNQSLAQARCDVALEEAWAQRTSAEFAVPPSRLAWEPGDAVTIDGEAFRITAVNDGEARKIEALAHDTGVYDPPPALPRLDAGGEAVIYGTPDAVLMDLPLASGSQPAAPWIAAQASPWPARLAVMRQTGTAAFAFSRFVEEHATMGASLTALAAADCGRMDHGHTLDVDLGQGALASVNRQELLNGANIAALGSDNAGYEIIQFETADLLAPGTYRLRGLLRGLGGSEEEVLPLRPAGERFVLLNGAVVQPAMTLAEAGLAATWRLGPQALDHGHPSYLQIATAGTLKALRPLPPVRLSSRTDVSGVALSWIRQTRVDGDSWDLAEVPLGETRERYSITILDGSTVKRSTETTTASFLYGATEMTTDFGASPLSFTVRVAQLSDTYGAGTALERIIHV